VRGGKLKERITIESATDAADASGQLIRTWATHKANWPAEHKYVSGGETFRGRQLSAESSHLFVIRELDTVTTKMRVLWETVYYGIVNVTEPREREMWLECKAAD
jgi:SPP1 family predicted phage head-tail adaptor